MFDDHQVRDHYRAIIQAQDAQRRQIMQSWGQPFNQPLTHLPSQFVQVQFNPLRRTR